MFQTALRTHRGVAVGAALIFSAGALAGCSGDSSSQQAAQSSVMNVPVTANSPDVMFAQMMIPHHEQAVVMAELADGRAVDPMIGELAREIRAAQDPEIELMTSWLEQWGMPLMSSDEAMGAHGSHGMAGMLTSAQLEELAAADGAEFDVMFAQYMIEHHEGAVQMARDVLTANPTPEVAALAREIIVTQEKEILQMQAFLGGSAETVAQTVQVVPGLGHLHGAVVEGGGLLVGSHDGVHRVDLASGESTQIGDSMDDFMGFAGSTSGTLVASGHPGPGSPWPNPLGLMASEDGGVTWQSRSLSGEVDFHGLAIRGDEVVGWDTRGPLQWSTDGGRTWVAGPTLTPTSLVWFGDEIWLATPDLGLVTWSPGSPDVSVVDRPGVLLAVSPDGGSLWSLDASGEVQRTRDGSEWEPMGQVTRVETLAADTDRAYAVSAGEIQIVP